MHLVINVHAEKLSCVENVLIVQLVAAVEGCYLRVLADFVGIQWWNCRWRRESLIILRRQILKLVLYLLVEVLRSLAEDEALLDVPEVEHVLPGILTVGVRVATPRIVFLP